MPYSRDTRNPSKPLSSLTIKDSKAYKYALFADVADTKNFTKTIVITVEDPAPETVTGVSSFVA